MIWEKRMTLMKRRMKFRAMYGKSHEREMQGRRKVTLAVVCLKAGGISA